MSMAEVRPATLWNRKIDASGCKRGRRQSQSRSTSSSSSLSFFLSFSCLPPSSPHPLATMVTSTPHSIPFSPACPVAHAHFTTTTPWTLQCYNSPSLHPITTLTRSTSTSIPGANNLIARTLGTPDTVRHWQSFWTEPTDAFPRGQVVALLALGEGLGGHVDTCHGGIVGVVLDECMNYAAAAWLSPG